MNAEPGQRVGELVLRHKLAEGGMGSVWVAGLGEPQRLVAVKFLATGALDQPISKQRFSLEASIAMRVRSSHVPSVLEYGFTGDGTPYLVMDLLEGLDLMSWIARHGSLSLRSIARLVDHVGQALEAAHVLGVVHRDVKPSNIIMTRAEGHAGDADSEDEPFHAYLIDFGIAKARDRASTAMRTHPGTTIGTPHYMSPEQLMGAADLDQRADIWSLAVVAYFCLTGAYPFDGKDFRELCLAIYCGDFPPVSSLRRDLSPSVAHALDRWFDKALSRELNARFRSVASMTRAFNVATGQACPEDAARAADSTPSLASTCATLSAIPTPRPRRRSSSRRLSSRPARKRRATLACALGGAALGAALGFFIVSPEAGQRWLSTAHASTATTSTTTTTEAVVDVVVRAPDASARHSL